MENVNWRDPPVIQNLPPSVTQAWAASNAAPTLSAATAGDLLKTAQDSGGLGVKDAIGAALYGDIAYLGVSATGANIYAHEAGHAVAANLMFQDANATISVTPFKGGVTRFMAGALTETGQGLGREGALTVVSGAGPLVDVAISMVSFATGYVIRKQHPIAGRAMMGYAAMTMLNDVLYAGSALGAGTIALAKTGNDFANLAVHAGIPPIVSVAVLAALLPAEYLLLRAAEKAIHGLTSKDAAPMAVPNSAGTSSKPAPTPPTPSGKVSETGKGSQPAIATSVTQDSGFATHSQVVGSLED